MMEIRVPRRKSLHDLPQVNYKFCHIILYSVHLTVSRIFRTVTRGYETGETVENCDLTVQNIFFYRFLYNSDALYTRYCRQ